MHWYVIANQREARIYSETNDVENLRLLKIVTNPLGNEPRRSLVHKQVGHGMKSIGRTATVRFQDQRRSDPVNEAVNQFARSVAVFLREQRLKKNFSELTIVAEPNFLGKLRLALDKETANAVCKWIKKDLQNSPNDKLNKILALYRSVPEATMA